MQYTTLGQTGIRVSKLGLGGAPLGGDFGATTEEEIERVIHTALDSGINFIDTAPLYGNGQSELRIGRALKGRRADTVLATKAVRRDQAYTYENTMSCFEDSLRRLQTDYIDLIQLHELERTNFEEAMNGTVAAFLKLKEEGKVRAIGVNAGKPEILLPFIASGKIDMVQNYGRYMLIDFSAREKLHPFAREHGVGIINGSVLGMGMLADSPAPFLANREMLEEAERRKAQLDFLRKPGPKGLIEPAMRFSLTCPDIAVTLTGTSSVQSLLKNIGYCDGQGLTEAEQTLLFGLFDGLAPVFG
ncbi:aldo/keto reductase [Paenibacillus nasutitermitis]|uniref:NADP-dependent oxidoreductase domain-containing protein n=1 Tax=Paenibacillus nasutitermitis TaxID=1652958 RepID=A0A916Z8T3_9BACL|nr:aldo/keto reductase [Paenibacillus nasutitermitis]GGD81398.1 hypothetical protein GCM10010911_44420 [Paenibacillus nasutitermitis]